MVGGDIFIYLFICDEQWTILARETKMSLDGWERDKNEKQKNKSESQKKKNGESQKAGD